MCVCVCLGLVCWGRCVFRCVMCVCMCVMCLYVCWTVGKRCVCVCVSVKLFEVHKEACYYVVS